MYHLASPRIPAHLLASLYEAAASNALLRWASIVALGFGMSSCVPAKSYEEARSAAETEFTAHGRTRTRLEAAHERIRTLEQSLAERSLALESGESTVAQAKLETTVATKDKEAAALLVEELRSELARSGNHLVVFSDEKRDLERALLLAEQRVRDIETAQKNLVELVGAARDLSLALGDAVNRDGLELGARDGQIVLGMPAGRLFAPGSDALVVEAAPVLAAVAKVSAEHPTLRVIVRGPDGAPLGDARATRLGAALSERGVLPARLVLPPVAAKREEPVIAPVAVDVAPASVAAPEASSASPEAPAAASPAPAAPVDEGALRYELAFAP